jgi:hypothetical protein
MSWFRKNLGLDFFDLAVQVVLTGMAMGFTDSVMPRGQGTESVLFLVAGSSVALLAWRRRRGLRQLASDPSVGLSTGQMAAARLEELEARVAELETNEARLLELEERLDFTERMLAQGTGERALPANGERR